MGQPMYTETKSSDLCQFNCINCIKFRIAKFDPDGGNFSTLISFVNWRDGRLWSALIAGGWEALTDCVIADFGEALTVCVIADFRETCHCDCAPLDVQTEEELQHDGDDWWRLPPHPPADPTVCSQDLHWEPLLHLLNCKHQPVGRHSQQLP